MMSKILLDSNSQPDEVWSFREMQPNGKFAVYKKYVKYYQGQPVVFSYDIDDPDDWTMYTADADETGKYSKMRKRVMRGILLHKKTD